MQQIYVLFATSTQRCNVLLDRVEGLTVKSLCNTLCEIRVKSVKAIRYQAPRLRSALLELSEDRGILKKEKIVVQTPRIGVMQKIIWSGWQLWFYTWYGHLAWHFIWRKYSDQEVAIIIHVHWVYLTTHRRYKELVSHIYLIPIEMKCLLLVQSLPKILHLKWV